MKEENCIFCKLAKGEIQTNTLYEDEQFRVILDLSPATKGHALILPKEHYQNIYEMPDKLLSDAIILAKKMAIKMTDAFHADGFNIVQNNNEVAGQTVFHFHIHLIPRYENDHQQINWVQGKLTEEAAEEIKKELVI